MQKRIPVTRISFKKTPSGFRVSNLGRVSAMRAISYKTRANRDEVKSFDCRVTTPAFQIPVFSDPPVGAEPGVAFTGITCINEVEQGDDYFQRIGSKITPKNVQLKFSIFLTTASTNSVGVRTMLVYDRQPNGAFPTLATILSDNNAGVSYHSGVNMTNRSRFSVLSDRHYDVDGGNGFGYTCNQFINLSKKALPMEYGPTTAAITEIRTGSLLFIAFTDSGTAVHTTNVIQLGDFTSRLRYFD